MKFYTSYYYQVRNFPKNLVGLSTAIWPPKYLTLGQPDKNGVLCINCPPLQPGSRCQNLCHGDCNPKQPNSCAFLYEYRQQLLNIHFGMFLETLKKLAEKIKKEEHLEDVDFAFLVFEAPTNLCSERGPIQQWLQFNGIEVEEWTPHKNIISS